MKKIGLLNRDLSEVIASMGHTDALVIADAGLPIPDCVRRIDLAVVEGIPAFLSVLSAVLTELKVERAVIAQEMLEVSPKVGVAVRELLGDDVQIETVPHEKFKELSRSAKAIVRTGEFTPYANVILYSGVVF